MLVRFAVLLSLPLCHLQQVEALPGLGWATEFLIDNADTAGIPLPGYVSLLSRKSGFLTKVLHLIFGDYFEEKFKKIIAKSIDQMPDSAPIDNVDSNTEEKMSFLNGKMTGLKTIQVTDIPNTKVEIIWSSTGFPVAVVSVQFKLLIVTGDIKTKFGLFKDVDGNAKIQFLDNNFVLKFHLYPGIFEWCYLRLFDVVVTDLEDMLWTIKRREGGTEDGVAESLMSGYFTSTDGIVEEHIKMSIANVIYHEIPKASPAICDNSKKYIKLSKYQTSKKTHEETKNIMAVLGGQGKGDNTQQQASQSEKVQQESQSEKEQQEGQSEKVEEQ